MDALFRPWPRAWSRSRPSGKALSPHTCLPVLLACQNVVELLAVVRRGVGGHPLADDLVRLVDGRYGSCSRRSSRVLLGSSAHPCLSGRFLAGFFSHSFGVFPALDGLVLVLLSSAAWAAQTIVGSPRSARPARVPLACRCWPKRSNSVSISPASAAPRGQPRWWWRPAPYPRARGRNRMNEKRSRIRNSSARRRDCRGSAAPRS